MLLSSFVVIYLLYYPFLGNVCDSRSFFSFAIKQIRHIVSRNQQDQSSLKAATLGETITGNSPVKDQVENHTDVKVPGKVVCDNIGARYAIMHNVLRVDCIIVAPAVFFQ